MADDTPSAGFRATQAQHSAIACAGAGPLCDLAKMAKQGLLLDAESARCFGAGFISDIFRAAYIPVGPPYPTVTYSADCVSISNTFQPTIKVAAADFPFFPIGSHVAFAGTGIPELDINVTPFIVISVDSTNKTFNINSADLSDLPAPINTTGRVGALTATTIYSDPPPLVEEEPYIPNGYEQAYADMAKEAKRHGKESD